MPTFADLHFFKTKVVCTRFRNDRIINILKDSQAGASFVLFDKATPVPVNKAEYMYESVISTLEYCYADP